eukprot:TRINITY_DN1939_c0_g1_i12.p3 TRINITY_DN1939_c0_g1~~TRINITY_DN1939_c0_g1_i12.p3  ORF type:complete len:172 (-),score=14.61 TRINITY_DN1939_c0_g1_i12:619-1134(-)
MLFTSYIFMFPIFLNMVAQAKIEELQVYDNNTLKPIVQDACRVDNMFELCDYNIQGGDKYLQDLDGGIDGVYSVVGCHNNKPKYIRFKPKGYEKVLWWSDLFADWEIANGTEPNEEQIISYGGEGLDEKFPNLAVSWYIAKDYLNEQKSRFQVVEYFPISLTIQCLLQDFN